jgi:hypothetical protein
VPFVILDSPIHGPIYNLPEWTRTETARSTPVSVLIPPALPESPIQAGNRSSLIRATASTPRDHDPDPIIQSIPRISPVKRVPPRPIITHELRIRQSYGSANAPSLRTRVVDFARTLFSGLCANVHNDPPSQSEPTQLVDHAEQVSQQANQEAIHARNVRLAVEAATESAVRKERESCHKESLKLASIEEEQRQKGLAIRARKNWMEYRKVPIREVCFSFVD